MQAFQRLGWLQDDFKAPSVRIIDHKFSEVEDRLFDVTKGDEISFYVATVVAVRASQTIVY